MNRSAFTLLEVVLVVAILAFVSLPGLFAIYHIRMRQSLSLSGENVTAVLKRAHIYAREAKGEAGWGVKFACPNVYSLWSRIVTGEQAEAQMILETQAFFDSCRSAFVPPATIWFNEGTGNTSADVLLVIGVPSGEYTHIKIGSLGTVEAE